NYSYFPVLIDGSYGPSRDAVYDLLKRHDILSRKYFYPLITHFPMYAGLPSAAAEKLPCAERIAAQVLCLPIYPDLSRANVEKICLLIRDGEK
ncbi:MAG: DegT/DnrJ/EryC1/StrS family aminotransferase, partial [Candidatus Marinimicrobia bacterium]|nr:DegT/DnrJ/EryC1/StrS family aminotransferase [Candidatus Neomarinimicrobiota bacterium]